MFLRVIAICGLKQSGKDTIADFLVSQYGYKKVRIAETLKEMCTMLFGLNQDQIEGSMKDQVDTRWGVSPRQIMQFFGTEVMQYQIQHLIPNTGRTFWIKSLLERHAHESTIVISDLRFIHEWEMIKQKYGQNALILKVVNPRTLNEDDKHVSEQEWLDIPAEREIVNDSTIEALHAKISELFINQS